LEPVIWNGENGVYDLRLITIKNLHDVPVCICILELEHVLTGLEKRVLYLNWLIDRENCLLVPLVRLRTRREDAGSQRGSAEPGSYQPRLDEGL